MKFEFDPDKIFKKPKKVKPKFNVGDRVIILMPPEDEKELPSKVYSWVDGMNELHRSSGVIAHVEPPERINAGHSYMLEGQLWGFDEAWLEFEEPLLPDKLFDI